MTDPSDFPAGEPPRPPFRSLSLPEIWGRGEDRTGARTAERTGRRLQSPRPPRTAERMRGRPRTTPETAGRLGSDFDAPEQFAAPDGAPAAGDDSTRRVLFLGGNGHADARLDAARAALSRRAEAEGRPHPQLELLAVAYPGFEGRPVAPDFETFLTRTERSLEELDPDGTATVYATGIGALVALALRARAATPQRRLILQGGVLWGLEQRLFPKLMRGPMPRLLQLSFRSGAMQRHFARKHFLREPSDGERAAFFGGYASCAAFPQLFRWLDARLLRSLERAFAARPAALRSIEVWWGARDTVVGLPELERTQEVLDTSWPVRVFDDWAHYPMLDAPEDWVRALRDAVATPARG